MRNVIIIGAGGHAKVIADIVFKNKDRLLGFLDDVKMGDVFENYAVIGKIEDCVRFAETAEFIVGIGDNRFRKKIAESYTLRWYTAIHPTAQLGFSSKIGAGSCVMANAVVNSGAHIGRHCIINTASVIEHDCRIADYVHVSPNATLCGSVGVGTLTHIGAGAVVKNNIFIAEKVTVGAGGVVVKNIEETGDYVGVPAKLRLRRE